LGNTDFVSVIASRSPFTEYTLCVYSVMGVNTASSSEAGAGVMSGITFPIFQQ
jgi:hypothetical protein